MDENLAESLQLLDKVQLRKELRPYLNGLQISSLFHRVSQLQAVLKNACWLSACQWNAETLQKELSGDYGKTYLCSFANRKQ